MPILSELLQMVSKSQLDEQVKQISDQIMAEERPKFKNPTNEPVGSNIFLAIEYEDKGNISFLCLERESKENYIVTSWSKFRDSAISAMKRKRVWETNFDKAEKLLKFYAETLKYVRGE